MAPLMAAAPAMAGAVPLAAEEARGQEAAHARTLVEGLRGEVAAGHDGTPVLVGVAEGPPAPALCAMARQHDAAAIVVGSRGRGPVRAGLLGSTSRELVRRAPCPVVICPPGLAVEHA
ncbi:MAG: universal stress protein [Solirubrobacterales bacterium]|nr:universal stress protein [Solirubrobacterales bacterium]